MFLHLSNHYKGFTMLTTLHHNNLIKTTTSFPQSSSKQHKSSSNLLLLMEAVIMGLVKDKAVVIFSKSSCYMSHTVKTLISSYGAYVTEYEIDAIPNGKIIEKALAQIFGQRGNVPVIFIGQKFIGGTNEIMSLQVRGQLVPLLREARAIWV